MTITTLLAIWGSVLSTGLFGFKIWEICRDKFKLHLFLAINTIAPDTNIVSITNDFKNAIIVEGLELF
jgi:hypothetical protein